MNIQDHFNEIAQQYDEQRRQFIPCFDDFYTLPLHVMDYAGDAPEVLDIGGGTGLFSSFVLQKYPNAKLTLIDLSDQMLECAKLRFGQREVTYLNADYTTYEFAKQFDIIISALSIHHLTAEDKRALYGRCYPLLREGGVFVNADVVCSAYPEVERMFIDIWKESLQHSTLPREEIEKGYKRMEYDKPSTVQDQLGWLKEAGFSAVECLYKYYHYAVMYAKK